MIPAPLADFRKKGLLMRLLVGVGVGGSVVDDLSLQ